MTLFWLISSGTVSHKSYLGQCNLLFHSSLGGGRAAVNCCLVTTYHTDLWSKFSTLFFEWKFPQVRRGLLGTHSIWKGAASYAACNGIFKDWFSTYGYWMGKKERKQGRSILFLVCTELIDHLMLEIWEGHC